VRNQHERREERGERERERERFDGRSGVEAGSELAGTAFFFAAEATCTEGEVECGEEDNVQGKDVCSVKVR